MRDKIYPKMTGQLEGHYLGCQNPTISNCLNVATQVSKGKVYLKKAFSVTIKEKTILCFENIHYSLKHSPSLFS
jgi:hypothetical protein